ncbi:MAG: TIGR04282 family arsenosugar biosynthesis glycosyltransferase [Gemmatimonadota bacterium]|nr:TIGR04282 family arsenosugar biosynthesis glycosyltransferase [Gemmatimonadota bacterium]
MSGNAVIVFVRAPRAGTVKTRLAASIGDEAALRVYRRLAERAVSEATASGAVVLVRFTPADAGEELRKWLGDQPVFLPQGEGELGARMERAFTEAFAEGYSRVVIVGSDLPDLSAELLRRAFVALERAEAVVGPALDGGYYLLGLRESLPEIFRGVPWSTVEVLACTLRALGEQGITPVILETLGDVDEAEDLPPGWVP